MGLSRAELLYRELEEKGKWGRKGTGQIPKAEERGGDIVNDVKKWKEYKHTQAIYAYMRLIKKVNELTFQKRFVKEYIELNKYLYEIDAGRPPLAVTADLGELPLSVTFELAPRPLLSDGKTDNREQNTERDSAGSQETI